MATRAIAGIDPNVVQSGPPNSAEAANLVKGIFVGYNADGEVVPADCRASAYSGDGPVRALGILYADATQKDPLGNTLKIVRRSSFAPNDGVRVHGYDIVPGVTYYLSSGGGITATKPGALTDDIDQEVGYGGSDGALVQKLGDIDPHA